MNTKLSEAELVWLKEAARRLRAGEPVSKRAMMVQLRDQLPKGFQPSDVRSGLLHHSGPTLLGLRILGDSKELLEQVERTLSWIRDQIIEHPETSQIRAEDLAEGLGLELGLAGRLLELICTEPAFAGGWTGPGQGGPISILVDREDIIASYLRFASLDEFFEGQSRSEGQTQPTGTEPDLGAQVHDVFVLMNMDPGDPGLDDVLNGIKDVCARFGLAAVRIDEEEHSDQITQRIIRRIRESDLIVADLSGERPNVYYEVGYAHALGKRPILYRKRGTRLHFDLSVHNVPEYSNVTDLKERLHGRLEAILGRIAEQGDT